MGDQPMTLEEAVACIDALNADETLKTDDQVGRDVEKYLAAKGVLLAHARATLAQRREGVTEAEQSLRDVILWALGEGDDFPERPDRGEGKPVRLYWWRSELRRRYEAALAASGEGA